MTKLQIDLSVARTDAELAVFEAHSEGRLSAQAASLLAREANGVARNLLESWFRERAELMAGVPARHAKVTTERFLNMLRTIDRVFTKLLASWSEAVTDDPAGIAKKSIDSLQATLVEVRRFIEEAEALLELLSRPPAPMTPELREMCAASREAFLRGEGVTQEVFLRERGKP